MTYIITSAIIIILAAIGVAGYFLARKVKRYITSSITELKNSQTVCQNQLVHINLPKILEKVNQHEITIRGINSLEDIASRLERNAETYKDVIIQFTERVKQIDDKLTDMTNAFSDHRAEQSDQLKGIFKKFQAHEKRFNEIQEKLIKLEREIHAKR